jgi:hypothetical protein
MLGYPPSLPPFIIPEMILLFVASYRAQSQSCSSRLVFWVEYAEVVVEGFCASILKQNGLKVWRDFIPGETKSAGSY